MKFTITFLTIFLSFLGPKIGLLDFSIIGSFLSFFLLWNASNVKVSPFYVLIVSFLLLILSYSVLIFLLHDGQDSQIYLRNVRALISTICLGLAFSNSIISSGLVLKCIKISILIHAVAILLQVAFPPLLERMAPLVGYYKPIFFLRAFGFANGFDTAGCFCVLGVILCFWSIQSKCAFGPNYFLMLVFGAASFFTARNIMVLSLIFIVIITFRMLASQSHAVKLAGLLNIALGYYVLFYFLGPILVASVPFLEPYAYLFNSDLSFRVEDSFSAGTTDLLDSMFFLPGPVESIFGSGYDNLETDVGYIKLVFMIGFVGLLLILIFHLMLFFQVLRLDRGFRPKKAKGSRKMQYDAFSNDLVITRSLITFFILLIWFNVKGLYLLTRGVHELLIIMIFTVLQAGYRLDKSKKR